MALKTPSNKALAGILLGTLSRYGSNAVNKTPLDYQVEKILGVKEKTRSAAKNITGRFEKVSLASRQRALGPYYAVTRMPMAKPDIDRLIANERERIFPPNGDDVEQPVNVTPASFTYFLEYKGLHCVDETNWDRGTTADEIYVVSSIVAIDPFNPSAEAVVRTEKHPLTQPYYSDVDDGETRDGPLAICWSGPASNLSLIVSVMEVDEGDPEAYKEEIHTIVGAAVAVAKLLGGPAWIVALEPLVVWGINELVGSSDDKIADVYRVLPWSDVIRYVNTRPTTDSTMKNIPYHFFTTHNGSGANYRALFGCRTVRN
jgi:hypothetical protein